MLLAGDIFTSACIRSRSGEFYAGSVYFCKEELSKYARVLYVKGNHEAYNDIFEESSAVLDAFLAQHAPNVTRLENDAVEIDGVLFLGCTLWTPAGTDKGLASVVQNGMNDFRVVYTRERFQTGHLRRFSPWDAADIHSESRLWLADRLADSKAQRLPTVVVTHHAPSLVSKDGNTRLKEFRNELDGAYYSRCDLLIKSNPQIGLWVHGHTHHTCSYKIGKTTVASNQRGYIAHERSAAHFDPSLGDFELETFKREITERLSRTKKAKMEAT